MSYTLPSGLRQRDIRTLFATDLSGRNRTRTRMDQVYATEQVQLVFPAAGLYASFRQLVSPDPKGNFQIEDLISPPWERMLAFSESKRHCPESTRREQEDLVLKYFKYLDTNLPLSADNGGDIRYMPFWANLINSVPQYCSDFSFQGLFRIQSYANSLFSELLAHLEASRGEDFPENYMADLWSEVLRAEGTLGLINDRLKELAKI